MRSGTLVCDSLVECDIFVTSLCAKRQVARTFMIIALIFSLLGFIYLVVGSILYCVRQRVGRGSVAIFFCVHFLSFLSAIIGFPTGIAFATSGISQMNGTSGSIGVGAYFAIVGTIMNFVGMILTSIGVMISPSDADSTDQKSSKGNQVAGDPTVQYNQTADNVDFF